MKKFKLGDIIVRTIETLPFAKVGDIREVLFPYSYLSRDGEGTEHEGKLHQGILDNCWRLATDDEIKQFKQ